MSVEEGPRFVRRCDPSRLNRRLEMASREGPRGHRLPEVELKVAPCSAAARDRMDHDNLLKGLLGHSGGDEAAGVQVDALVNDAQLRAAHR